MAVTYSFNPGLPPSEKAINPDRSALKQAEKQI